MTANQYQAIINRLIKEHDITVVKYYKTFQGNAIVSERKIWIPKPVCETSFCIALHEIGHIVSKLPDNDNSWKHEYAATKYAIEQAKKEGVNVSEELIESMKGYLKYVIFEDLKKIYIDAIPNKVFRLAGLNKYYWRKQIEAGKKFSGDGEMPAKVFRQWKNFKVKWE